MKLSRVEIRKTLQEAIIKERRNKFRKLLNENLAKIQLGYLKTLNESLLTGSADAMGDFIMISTNGKVIRSPNTVKGVAKATSKAIFTGNTIPKGCKGLYRVIGVEGEKAIVARVSATTGKVLTRKGSAETIKVSKDAITRSSVLYMNGLRGSEYKITTDTGKMLAQTSKGELAVLNPNSSSPAAQKAVEKANKLLPMNSIIDPTAPESTRATFTNANSAIKPPAANLVKQTEKLATGLIPQAGNKMLPGSGVEKLANIAVNSAKQTPDDFVAYLTSQFGQTIFNKGAEKLSVFPGLESAMINDTKTALAKQGFRELSEETLTKIVRANAAQLSNEVLNDMAKLVGAGTVKDAASTSVTKATQQSASNSKALSNVGNNPNLQRLSRGFKHPTSGNTIVAETFDEAAAKSRGNIIAKNQPRLIEAVENKFVERSAGKMTQEEAKIAAKCLLGSASDDSLKNVISANAGKETIEVGISASRSWLQTAAKALGPAIVLAFGFNELYEAFTNEDLSDEQFYEAITFAGGNMLIGFGTMSMAIPATIASLGLAGIIGYAVFGGIAATLTFGASYLAGSLINDYLSVDVKDAFVKTGRQAADKMKVLLSTMTWGSFLFAPGGGLYWLFTGENAYNKWLEEEDWYEDFKEAAEKSGFNGLKPNEVDPERRKLFFGIMFLRRNLAQAGKNLNEIQGKQGEEIKKLNEMFLKGFLDQNAWASEFKKMKKIPEVTIKEPEIAGEGEDKVEPAKKKATSGIPGESKKKSSSAKGWDSYISKTNDKSSAKKIRDQWKKISPNKPSYYDWVKWYNKLRKTGETGSSMKLATKDKNAVKSPGPNTHYTPEEVYDIMAMIGQNRSNQEAQRTLNEIRKIEDLIFETKTRTKIIQSQKLIYLID